MKKWLLCAAVFLCFSSVLASEPTNRQLVCAAGIELIYLTYGLSGEANVKPRYRLEEHVTNSMRAVLEAMRGLDADVPLLFVEPRELRNAEDLWWRLMRTYRGHQYHGSPDEVAVELTAWPEAGVNTFKFEKAGVTYRFQLAAAQGTMRVQYNADRLNSTMELKTSLTSRLAFVNGQQGVLSEWVEGRELENATAADIDRMLTENEIDETSFSDASAFEWLVNHSRCATSRFVVTPQKQIVVVSRSGGCLNCSTNAPPEGDQFYLGWTLPKRYSRRFIAKLKEIDREKLSFSIQLDLGTAESAALLFRREVILKDVELRGEAALIP